MVDAEPRPLLLPVLYWVKLVKLGSEFVVGSLFWTAADGSPSGLWATGPQFAFKAGSKQFAFC